MAGRRKITLARKHIQYLGVSGAAKKCVEALRQKGPNFIDRKGDSEDGDTYHIHISLTVYNDISVLMTRGFINSVQIPGVACVVES